MLNKIYFGTWALIGLAAAAVFVTGNLTELAVVIFGFICFTMVFMGMMSVLPNAVHDAVTRH